MFTIIKELPENILGVVVSGKITKADFDRLNPLMEEHKAKYGKIKLLIEYREFKWPTAKAMWEDLKMGLKYVCSVKRVAVVTDKDWIENVAQAAAAIISGLKVESYETDEREKAIEWMKKTNS